MTLLFILLAFNGVLFVPLLTGHEVRVNYLPGGMLWLDCVDLTTPKVSLLHLTWRKGTEAFYYQDFSDDIQNYLGRTRLAKQLASRIQVPNLGQMGIHPAMLQDQGTYTCEALVILGNGVMARVKKRVFTAVIGMGYHYYSYCEE